MKCKKIKNCNNKIFIFDEDKYNKEIEEISTKEDLKMSKIRLEQSERMYIQDRQHELDNLNKGCINNINELIKAIEEEFNGEELLYGSWKDIQKRLSSR